MSIFTQEKRLLSLTTPLGEDVLLLAGFSGAEGMSQLFSYQLDLLSEEEEIDPTAIVGKNVTWQVEYKGGKPRFFNGFVSRFHARSYLRHNLRAYRAEVVPWLWFLTRTADCRIFQKMSVKAILNNVFTTFGFGSTDYYDDYGISPSLLKREYCVQYRESAFNFVSRLMEQEGIFYYFRHDDGKHTLVLGEGVKDYVNDPDKDVCHAPAPGGPGLITAWDHEYSYRSGKWSQTAYNFETPRTNLLTTSKTLLNLTGASRFEMFDYPGTYLQTAHGDTETRIRMEEEEAGYEVTAGAGGCTTFTPGAKFTLREHAVAAEQGKYVLTSVQHAAREDGYSNSTAGGEYSNTFTCIPAAVVFRPARLTPKPIVQGPQTAVIVGKEDEEIHIDQYGRVKVQFFWDRYGRYDEHSSCWIRVSENWAGKGWGMVCHPRVGQEVIVDFLEGNPDRPIITGRVYNADQTPPYKLPEHKTQSGIKSRSTLKGTADNFNEIRFEDKKGHEQVVIHAERNLSTTVEASESRDVGWDRSTTIGHDDTLTVKKGNSITTVEKGYYFLDVQNNDYSHHVKGDVQEWYDNNQTTQVQKDIDITAQNGHFIANAGTQAVFNAQSLIWLQITATPNLVLMDGDGIFLTGAKHVTAEVDGNLVQMDKDGTILLYSKAGVQIIVGESSITLNPSEITIEAPTINLKSKLGNINVQANDLFKVEAEKILLN